MKRLALLAGFGLLLPLAGLGGAYEMDTTARPDLSLCEAYGLALGAIGGATNTHHCIDARLEISTPTMGRWVFKFSPDKRGEPDKWALVNLDRKRKVEIQDVILRY